MERVVFSRAEEARRLLVEVLVELPPAVRSRLAARAVGRMRDAGFFQSDVERHFSAVQVADLLGRSPAYITAQVRSGLLSPACRDAGGWLLPGSAVNAWLGLRSSRLETGETGGKKPANRRGSRGRFSAAFAGRTDGRSERTVLSLNGLRAGDAAGDAVVNEPPGGERRAASGGGGGARGGAGGEITMGQRARRISVNRLHPFRGRITRTAWIAR